MHNSNSGLSYGTTGSGQMTLEQQIYSNKVSEIEQKAKAHEDYLKNELPQSSPLKIPSTATFKEERKNGYEQVKYNWSRGEYKYQSRWHTRTLGAPVDQGNSWVVEKRKPGIGHGKNACPAERYVLVGKSKSGKYKWVEKKEWDAAIRARRNGPATKEQKEMLDNGHWKAD